MIDFEQMLKDRWSYDVENACPCCGGSGHKDDCRAPVAVKPLDWEEGNAKAESLGIEYTIDQYLDGTWGCCVSGPWWFEGEATEHPDEAAAIAAAQADYDQRILSSLEPSLTEAEIRAAVFQEAFLAGFMASGEGWNGEYPNEDRESILADIHFQRCLTEAIRKAGE